MFFSGVLVLQKAITGMFTYEASVTGYSVRDISQPSGVTHPLTQTISTQVLYIPVKLPSSLPGGQSEGRPQSGDEAP